MGYDDGMKNLEPIVRELPPEDRTYFHTGLQKVIEGHPGGHRYSVVNTKDTRMDALAQHYLMLMRGDYDLDKAVSAGDYFELKDVIDRWEKERGVQEAREEVVQRFVRMGRILSER